MLWPTLCDAFATSFAISADHLIHKGFCVANKHHVAKLTLSPSTAEVIHYVNDSHIVICNSHNMTRVRWMNPKNAVVEDKRGRLHIEEMNGGKKELHLAMSFEKKT